MIMCIQIVDTFYKNLGQIKQPPRTSVHLKLLTTETLPTKKSKRCLRCKVGCGDDDN